MQLGTGQGAAAAARPAAAPGPDNRWKQLKREAALQRQGGAGLEQPYSGVWAASRRQARSGSGTAANHDTISGAEPPSLEAS